MIDHEEYVKQFSSVPTADPIGYIELDGNVQNYATSEDEKFFLGDSVEEGVTVYIGCSKCTCEYNQLTCAKGQCECKYVAGKWDNCTTDCDAYNQRTRVLTLVGDPESQPQCEETKTEFEPCDYILCPTTPSSWGTWNNCTTSDCDVGTRKREKQECSDYNPSFYVETESCIGNDDCNANNCTGDKIWWSGNAGDCNLTCTDYRLGTCIPLDETVSGCRCPDGMVEHDGVCYNPEDCPCISCDGQDVLEGETIDVPEQCKSCTCTNGEMECDVKAHCCIYSTWSQWSDCDADCGRGAKRRSRGVVDGNKELCTDTLGQKECVSTSTCQPECIVDGVSYSESQQMPSEDKCKYCICKNGGAECYSSTQAVIHGNWASWGQWSACSHTCTGGIRTRLRSCSNPIPECGGDMCDGNSTQTEDCMADVSCCEVTSWSTWSGCTMTCVPEDNPSAGFKVRTRNYTISGDANNPDCSESLEDILPCNIDPCNMTCNMSSWSEWTGCTVTCGSGSKTRTRTIYDTSNPDCDGLKSTETEDCNAGDCPCTEPNTIWSNTTSCSSTCKQQNCTDVYEGCVCKEGYNLDKNGDCVTESDCNKCHFQGQYYENKATWVPLNDSCSSCLCLEGSVSCNAQCQIPESCAEDEELYHDPVKLCCPYCKKKVETCSLKIEQKKMVSGNCETVEEVDVTYCSGSCLESSMKTLLIGGVGNDTSAYIKRKCNCCVGITDQIVSVQVNCTDNGFSEIKIGSYVQFKGCMCDACLTTEIKYLIPSLLRLKIVKSTNATMLIVAKHIRQDQQGGESDKALGKKRR
ncbi:hypothetical protein KUTeg_008847 [Tegillarca granosa]|uniref:SCO-spondin n=1 Tax=Tegillarca granosa TaxID=220873 RepID=A0ABQ9FAF1_TEGGR|nr:hypothetical protein KUTeg_008847 [Tegillarca granosa]